MIEERERGLIIEEYRALRAESLRCSQTVATTVWVAITGFLVTAGAAAAAGRWVTDLRALMLISLILLVLQGLGASAMFLAEYWRFIRIGIYIRTKIEQQFVVEVHDERPARAGADLQTWRPISWEHWIQGKRRAAWFPLVSLFVLQLPAVTTLILGGACLFTLVPWIQHFSDSSLILHAGIALTSDLSLTGVLLIALGVNLTVVVPIARSIYREIKLESGEKLIFSARPLTIARK